MILAHLRALISLLPWGSLVVQPCGLSFSTLGPLASAAKRAQFLADHQIWPPPVAEVLEVLEVVAVT
jgi:hypothetical protein